MWVAMDSIVTVDQPPLAVGVRFPLCPPIFFAMTTGLIGPSFVFYADRERRPNLARR